MSTWIAANSDGKFHLGLKHELRGDKSGKVYSTHYITACSRKQLGGAWGYWKSPTDPRTGTSTREICSRCFALASKLQETTLCL